MHHQHDGVRPWNQRSTGQERRRQTQTQRKPRRVSDRLRRKAPTRRSRQTRHTHRLRPAQGTSQTCPRCGDRHRNNRESQAVFRCRNSSKPTPRNAVIIRNRSYELRMAVRLYTDVLTAPTGWREQPSGSEPRQPRLGLELSVFKPEGTATSSHGSRVRGPRPARRIKRRAKAPKVLRIVLVTEHSLGVTRNYPLKT